MNPWAAHLPDPEHLPRLRAGWHLLTLCAAIAVAVATALAAMSLHQLRIREGALRPALVLRLLPGDAGIWTGPAPGWTQYRHWARDDPAGFRLALLAMAATSLVTAGWLGRRNPFPAVPPIHGDARLADAADLRRIERGQMASVARRRVRRLRLLHLGLVPGGRALVSTQTLSALVIAPPGAGKTAGCIVPTILTAADTSFIVHDLKPEITQLTAGWRATLGPVFVLDWAAAETADTGDTADMSPGLARWNPLAADMVPPPGGGRDLYLDRLVHVLIPDDDAPDPFWPRKAQAMLTGCLQFLVARINDRTGPDRYGELPPEWHGQDASLPMLLDWLTHGQLTAQDEAGRGGDPMREFLRAAIAEARRFCYPQRALQELVDLAATSERTRDGIVATVTAHLSIFRNQAVRTWTSGGGLRFSDLRGVRARNGTWLPVTVYLRTRQEDAKALAVINALFIDLANAYLLSTEPGGIAADGTRQGPHRVCFALDELPQLPRLEAATIGPAVGRAKGISFLLAAQDLAQLEVRYGKEQVAALQTNCAYVIVFNQNNAETAKTLSDRIGSLTYVKTTRTDGADRAGGWWNGLLSGSGRSRSLEGRPLLTAQQLMSIPAGTHYVLVQGFNHRPIRARTPFHFANRGLRGKVRGPWRPGPRPAPCDALPRLAPPAPPPAAAPSSAPWLFLVGPADLPQDGVSSGPLWAGVSARPLPAGWCIDGFHGPDQPPPVAGGARECRVVLFAHTSRAALEPLVGSLPEERCSPLDQLRRAAAWPAGPTASVAAGMLPPHPERGVCPDMLAMLLMELTPPPVICSVSEENVNRPLSNNG